MSSAVAAVRSHIADLVECWNRFWFTPADPVVLSAIRVLTGALLFWTHLVWSFGLTAFFGKQGWIPAELHARAVEQRMALTWFDLTGSPAVLWTLHVLSLVAFFLLMIGLFSRTVAVISYIAAINYAIHATPGAFFGLDKINCLLAMYVMLGPCGARYSVDRLLRRRRGDATDPPASWTANLAVRLIQVHLCVVYLFSGLGKLQGSAWWDGSATWFAMANVEYRSLNMTWMADHLWLSELLAHATVFWELFYCVLIWVPLLRPWMLLIGIQVHAFIGLAMGMPEFAAAMLVANAAFLSPGFVGSVCDPLADWIAGRLGGGNKGD